MTCARRGSRLRQCAQGIVEGAHLSGAIRVPGAAADRDSVRRRVFDPLHAAAALGRGAGARRIDENPPHDRCGDGQEVGAVLPVHRAGIHQPHERFVHERGRVSSRRPHAPSGRTCRPSSPQVVVHEWRQALERLLIAATPGLEQRRDVGRGEGIMRLVELY